MVGISPPKQEIWLSNSIRNLNIKAGICAGATIDFLAGAIPRAPLWMQRVELEWVFRVLTEPRRLAPRYAKDGVAVTRLLLKRATGRWRTNKQ